MMKFILTNPQAVGKTAVSMEQAVKANGELALAVVVTFSDNTRALVSGKHFEEDGTVKFLNEKHELTMGYTIQNIQGQPWIVEKNSRSSIKL